MHEQAPSRPTPTYVQQIRALPWMFTSEALNAFFASITFGSSVFVLFLSELGLDKAAIGFLLSLFPFCGLVALPLARWIGRVGPKRVFLLFYGARKFVIISLLLTPWVLQRFGEQGAFFFVTGVIVIFALCRAIAETGFYPWYQESVPNAIRGKVGAVSNILSTIMIAAALGTASFILGHGTGLERYSLLIALGAIVGIVSVLVRIPVPGGAPTVEADGAHLVEMRGTLRDARFVRYLAAITCSQLGMTITAFLPLFLKQQMGFASQHVVLVDVAGTAGGFLASYAWGWAADRWGGRRTAIAGVVAMAAVPLCWMLIPRGLAWSYPLAMGCMALWGAVTIGNTIGATRLLFNSIIPPEKATTYFAVWYAWAGLVTGIGALGAGWLLQALGAVQGTFFGLPLDLFTPVFLACTLLLLGAGLLFRAMTVERE
jgi:MFS-type transporter involved in bile tolerance (Atg22 family)